MDIKQYQSIQRWARDLDGVFALSDLKVLLDEPSDATCFRKLARLVETGTLIKVKQGIYATPDATLLHISNKIAPDSYVSTGTILAQKAIIGSVPAHRVQAVKTGRPRTYTCALGTIELFSINPRLFFGFNSVNGIRVATPEKAFLDVCYFFYKGTRFSFDPAVDTNTRNLDFDVINGYLERYDKRFVTFFNRIWRNK